MVTTHNIFISHSWNYTDAYERLADLLDARSYFSWQDFSVPRNDPIHTTGSDTRLYAAIKNKIQLCHVVLVNAGVYATYSKWIDKELEIARSGFLVKKPIVAVEP